MSDPSFEVSESVVDCANPQPSPLVVVAVPATTASEWVTYGGMTVAQANPAYPADAPTVLVVDATDVDTYLSEWEGETPLRQSALDETGVYYEAVPAPRLTTPESEEDATGNDDSETDTA